MRHKWHVLSLLIMAPVVSLCTLLFAELAAPQFSLGWVFCYMCPLSAFAASGYLALVYPQQNWLFHLSCGITMGLIVNNLILTVYGNLVTPSITHYTLIAMAIASVLGGNLIKGAHAIMVTVPHPDLSLLRSKHVWEHSLLPLASALGIYLLGGGH